MTRIFLVAIISVACAAIISSSEKQDELFTLEQFGGEAWYLPTDGRLQEGVQYPLIDFTPATVDKNFLNGTGLKGTNYTKITAKTNSDFFPADIVGKSFCGLFAHQNPNSPNYDAVDDFYPSEIGSRYAKVVHRIDGKNVIVDFEFNGGDLLNPKKTQNGKGYFFFDNSRAWEKLQSAFSSALNNVTEVKLKGFGIKNSVQVLYVIPQYKTWKFTSLNCKIWSGTKNIPALKIGFEDYYQHEQVLGKNIIDQDKYVFSLAIKEHHDFTLHAKILPPHRRVLESNTWHGYIVGGRKKTGITAIIGSNQLFEEEQIVAGKGLTQETFISFSGSAVGAGGSTKGTGILQEIDQFGYVLFKDYKQRGQMFTQMNATYGGGNYLVVENAELFFDPQESVNPPSQPLRVRINNSKEAYEGFHPEIVKRSSYYLPYVLEAETGSNLFKVFAAGGTARTNIVALKGNQGVITFMSNIDGEGSGELAGYWEWCYRGKNPRWNRMLNSKVLPGRTANKLILFEAIPLKGRRYIISRDYRIKEKYEELVVLKGKAKLPSIPVKFNHNADPGSGQIFPNVVRTAVCWTTILQKFAIDIDPVKEIPANGLPLALQPGDKFKIPAYDGSSHNPNEIFTVTRKDRGHFTAENPAEFMLSATRKENEFNQTSASAYRFFWCQLDKDLPASIGLTFAIEMVYSSSEELLDGQYRDAYQTYKGTGRIGENGLAKPNSRNAHGYGGYDVDQALTDSKFTNGEPLGHLCYSQVELTEWYKNVHWNNGFYRQNSNGGRGFEKFDTKDNKGKTVKRNPLARYSAGKTFINCTGGPVGQYSSKLDDFQVRDWITTNAGIKQPESQKAKMRLYNSPDVRTKGLKEPEKYLETFPTDENAPDMPKACRDLLNSLPH